MGKFWKKALKVIAIVAAVVAIAWVAAPLLGAFGEAITAGISAVGEAIASGFTALGEALGISGATTVAPAAVETATTTASTVAAGTEAAAGTAAAGSAAGEAALLTLPEGSAAATSGIGVSAGEAAAINAPLNIGASEIAASAVPGAVTQTAATGALGQIGAWVQKNPLVAATLLKGAGDFATSLSQDPLGDRMALEEWQTQRMSDSITGMGMPQYKDPSKPNVLRRLDGTPVFTNVGGVPNGALSKVMPGYGDPNYKPQPKPPGG